MSTRNPAAAAQKVHRSAPVFAALGDETRLTLVVKLGGEPRQSIAQLTAGQAITRQAVTKHLRVLEEAGLVRGVKRGRENLFELAPQALVEARQALDVISQQWDEALARLKAFVED